MCRTFGYLPEERGLYPRRVAGDPPRYVLGGAHPQGFPDPARARGSPLTATAARVEQANQATLPVTMLLVVGVSIAFMAWGMPDSPVAVAASFFPFLTPMVMFARIALASVPPWQIAVGVVLSLLTAWGALVLSGRLYRNNVVRFRRVGLLAGRASPRS